MWHSKSAKKEHSNGENCWEDSQQGNYLGGQINGMTKNIGGDWKKLEMIEGQKTSKKRNDEDDPGRGRS